MRVAMIGTGYVGLVSGACFADFGHTVCCIDKDEGKIQRLREGIMPIYEPGLDQLVAQNVREGRLSFDTDAAEAVKQADAVFIAVGTPSRRRWILPASLSMQQTVWPKSAKQAPETRPTYPVPIIATFIQTPFSRPRAGRGSIQLDHKPPRMATFLSRV